MVLSCYFVFPFFPLYPKIPEISAKHHSSGMFNISFSHHSIETHVAGRLSPSSHRYRNGHVLMYCKTVFCLHRMYYSTSSSPTPLIASLRGRGVPTRHQASEEGYFQSSGGPPWFGTIVESCASQGVTTHVYDQNRKTAFMTALKHLSVMRTSSPYHPRILYVCDHFFWYFCKLKTTTIQSSSVAVRMCPRYLKAATFSSGQV